MYTVIREAIGILTQAAPYLLFGYLVAGLLSVFLNRYQSINALLGAPGHRPVYLATLFGIPMPLCSCSVLPAALALRKQGVSKGATASFLISVPETDIISIVLTYALLGPLYAVFRPLAALVTAITTGLVVNRIDTWDEKRRPPEGAAETAEGSSGSPGAGECCEGSASGGSESGAPPGVPGKAGWLRRALRFGFVEMFDDIMVQLLIGILIAGAVVAWLPGWGLKDAIGGSPVTYLIMLAVGIPVYVCATASTPLAVGLIAGGVSPGAALVFLLAGPATNVASLIVLNNQFGRRVLAGYLGGIAVVSVLMGLILDAIIGPGAMTAVVEASPIMGGGASVLEIAATVLLLVLVGFSIRRTRLLDRWSAGIHRRLGVIVSPGAIRIAFVAIVAIGYVSSGFFVVGAGERGAVKRFGRVISTYLPPGLHYAPPVPFGGYDVESMRKVRRVEIGYRSDQLRPSSISLNESDPFSEEAWMLGGDENIIDVKCVAHYRIIDSREAFMNYMYGVNDRESLLRGAAEWALRSSVGSRAIDSLLTVDREAVESEAHEEMQRRLDASGAGVEVVGVNIHSIHAPPPVHWAFRDVASAAEDQKQKENIAQQYWEKRTLEARGEASGMIAEAKGKALEHVEIAEGNAHAFEAQSEIYRNEPELMRTRLYLELMDRVLPGMNKYVDLMPRGTKGPDVWLRMGPKKDGAPLGKD